MGEVSWIKLEIDMFDNAKIKYIRRLPEGDTMLVVWIYILTLAGKTNDQGRIYLTESVPYDEQMLADESGIPVRIIHMAMGTFERLEMIHWDIVETGYIEVLGWQEHQNLEKLEKIKLQNKKRQEKFREKHKLLELCDKSTNDNVKCNSDITLPVTLCNVTVTEQSKNIEEDKDKEEDKIPPISPEDVTDNLSEIKNLSDEYNFSDVLRERFLEWTHYKDSRGESYAIQSIKPLMKRLYESVVKYGEDSCIALIDEAMMNGWKNIQFKHLESLNEKNNGSTSYMDSIDSRVSKVDSW